MGARISNNTARISSKQKYETNLKVLM